jgi:hypothetical protein
VSATGVSGQLGEARCRLGIMAREDDLRASELDGERDVHTLDMVGSVEQTVRARRNLPSDLNGVSPQSVLALKYLLLAVGKCQAT